eukprot:gene13863-15311_t
MASTTSESVLQDLIVLQRMVDISITTLEGLRKENSSTSDLIQQEIKTVEGKLMKLFSRQLSTIYKNQNVLLQASAEVTQYPKLDQFLYVVDIEDPTVKNVAESCHNIQELCAMSDERLRRLFSSSSNDDDTFMSDSQSHEIKRLTSALRILRTYSDRLRNGDKASDFVWESWDKLYVDDSLPPTISYHDARDGPVAAESKSLSLPHSVRLTTRSIPPSPTIEHKYSSSITRSRSDDANVGRRIHLDSGSSSGSGHAISPTKGHGTRPRPLNLTVTNMNGSESGTTDSDVSHQSAFSQSPRTPTRLFHFGMGHSIKHMFSAKTFLISLTCEYCHRMMFVGVKCKDCGFKCHKKCSRKAPPSCGLPPKLEKVFKDTLKHESAGNAFRFYTLPNMKRTASDPSSILLQVDKHLHARKGLAPNRSHGDLAMHAIDPRIRGFSENYPPSSMSHSGDSCSTTSSTSSVPSSPAITDSPNEVANAYNVPYYMSGSSTSEFVFPVDEENENGLIHSTAETETSTLTGTMKSNVSVDTMTRTEDSWHSKSSSGTKSTESTISENDDFAVDNLDSQISDVIPQRVRLRDEPLSKADKLDMLMNLHERGSLMSEWVIPYADIEFGELIGKGRMGEVYKAKWHGEVAVKILHVENPSEKEKTSFKYKVQTFRKTRHENLILFMGACMEPPTFAIVTSFCKGSTLHQYIHEQNYTFDNNRIIMMITQVAQGMGYLHARRIVHKDLNSKNIFVEKHRCVITDFGLLNVADSRSPLERPGWLLIINNWICYQAPEIICALDPADPGREVKKYTKESDIYAFGTVWYELLSKRFPFDDQPTESTIWQIGKGFKQSLSKLEVSRDAKDILAMCWAFSPENRPQFHLLTKAFERLPKKKLIRSPSQPMYPMSRSADALVLF